MRAAFYSKALSSAQTELATRLILARLRAGLTQRAAADEATVGFYSLRAWEAGRRVPDVYELMRVCAAYGTTAAEILRGM